MVWRILRAVPNPRVTMLGHATGRLLLERDSYHVDLEAVLQAAAEAGTMIEINADPHRLDLDWIHCKRAKAIGVMLVINPDAHSTGGLRTSASASMSPGAAGWRRVTCSVRAAETRSRRSLQGGASAANDRATILTSQRNACHEP